MKTEAKVLIINAYKLGNKQTKRKLEQAFPEYFKTFEKGDWIKHNYGTLVRITDFEKKSAYGFEDGKWVRDTDWTFKTNPEHWQKATSAEVIEAFKKEFEKRGFKEGVKFNTLKQKGILTLEFTGLNFLHFFDKEIIKKYGQCIYSKGWLVYKEGVFAEIVEEEKTIEKRVEFIERFICSNKYKVFRNGRFVELEEPKTIEQRLEVVEQFIKEFKNQSK